MGFFLGVSGFFGVAIEVPPGCYVMTTRVMPFSGLNGQPRETTHHLPGPI